MMAYGNSPPEGAKSDTFIRLYVDLKHHLHRLKGKELSVLMCIAMYMDEDRYAYPNTDTIAQNTGYCRSEVSLAIRNLTQTYINARPVLIVVQGKTSTGQYANNRYIVFPTDAQIEENTPYLTYPCPGKPDTVKPNNKYNHLHKNNVKSFKTVRTTKKAPTVFVDGDNISGHSPLQQVEDSINEDPGDLDRILKSLRNE